MIRSIIILSLLVPTLCYHTTIKLEPRENKIFSGHERYVVQAETLNGTRYSLFILRNETINYDDVIDGCLFTTDSCHVNGTDRRSKFVAIKNEDEYEANFYISIERLTYPRRISRFGLVVLIALGLFCAVPILIIINIIMFFVYLITFAIIGIPIGYCLDICSNYYKRNSEV